MNDAIVRNADVDMNDVYIEDNLVLNNDVVLKNDMQRK